MKFTELPIPESVMAGIRDSGFDTCTPIQELTLPLTLAGHDVAGQAQTGTGKTAAFLIAAFTRLLATNTSRPCKPGYPRCLIIAPTRELAVQIEMEAIRLGCHTGLTVGAVYGGVDYEKQRLMLQDTPLDILVGTPGRLIDYYKQRVYHGNAMEVLVIDEADRMFDMGFIVDLRYLMRRLPPPQERLSMLFTATLSYRAQELSYEHMNQPEVIATKSDVRTVDQVSQSLYHIEGTRKISLLVGLLRRDLVESVENGDQGSRVMIFINTKRMGERLENWLRANQMRCGYLSGDVPQTKRLKVLQRFQDGEIPILIATDVAGRGLHIEGITHVINYDLPENAEDYVHRIGRTARAGAKGDAISLVDEEGAYCLEAIEAYVGMKIPVTRIPDGLMAGLTRPPPLPPREGEEWRGGRRDSGRPQSDGGRRPATRSGYGPSRSGTSAVTAPADGSGTRPPSRSGRPPPRRDAPAALDAATPRTDQPGGQSNSEPREGTSRPRRRRGPSQNPEQLADQGSLRPVHHPLPASIPTDHAQESANPGQNQAGDGKYQLGHGHRGPDHSGHGKVTPE